MKYCFILNPTAGKGRSLQLQSEIDTICAARGVDHDVFVSDGVENTCTYVRNISDALGVGERATFFACGGDGTICKTVLAVMAIPREKRGALSVGVIPMGTGNDFVSNFANKELFFDIDAQIDGSTVEIDLLRCNDLYSVNMINIGFDCHVVCTKEAIGKRAWVPRKFAYIFALLITLIKKPGVSLSISHNGEAADEKKLLLTTYANGAYCGGGFYSNPTASLYDGLIDCLEVKNVGRIKFLSLVGDYKAGRHLGEKFKKIIDHRKSSRVDMVFDRQTPVSVDGEVVYTDELHLSVVQRAINILLPRGVVAKTAAGLPAEASAR